MSCTVSKAGSYTVCHCFFFFFFWSRKHVPACCCNAVAVRECTVVHISIHQFTAASKKYERKEKNHIYCKYTSTERTTNPFTPQGAASAAVSLPLYAFVCLCLPASLPPPPPFSELIETQISEDLLASY